MDVADEGDNRDIVVVVLAVGAVFLSAAIAGYGEFAVAATTSTRDVAVNFAKVFIFLILSLSLFATIVVEVIVTFCLFVILSDEISLGA